MLEKPKKKFIKKAALAAKKEKPKVKSMADRAMNMYGKKKGK